MFRNIHSLHLTALEEQNFLFHSWWTWLCELFQSVRYQHPWCSSLEKYLHASTYTLELLQLLWKKKNTPRTDSSSQEEDESHGEWSCTTRAEATPNQQPPSWPHRAADAWMNPAETNSTGEPTSTLSSCINAFLYAPEILWLFYMQRYCGHSYLK